MMPHDLPHLTPHPHGAVSWAPTDTRTRLFQITGFDSAMDGWENTLLTIVVDWLHEHPGYKVLSMSLHGDVEPAKGETPAERLLAMMDLHPTVDEPRFTGTLELNYADTDAVNDD